jgi:glycosyltransferase involved in cell wall biosynthesis
VTGVSVIIPTFGRPAFLSRAVESAAGQTRPPEEIIVVDDNEPGSEAREATRAMIPRLESSFGVRYLPLERNSGGGAARNAGVAESSGAYLAFLDDDDWWLPSKLEKQLSVITGAPSPLGLVYTGRRIVDERGELKRERIPADRGHIYATLLRENVIGTASCALVSREAFERVGGFDPTLPARQDLDLWVRIAERYALDFVSEALTVQTEHDSGRVSRTYAAKAAGLEAFVAKHHTALRGEPAARAANYYVLGRFYLKHGRPLRGRGFLLRSLLVRPRASAVRLLLAGVAGKRDETAS